MNRPTLDMNLEAKEFAVYYFLKEELVAFCRKQNLPTSGSKIELTERISYFLDTGKVKLPNKKQIKRKTPIFDLSKETIIEADFVCSEVHRQFFENEIGPSFKFNVGFQKWLKNNQGKTYADALENYHKILEAKKQSKGKNEIDKQFEYNTYIRDFFKANKDKSLKEAISCWKYKKALKGNNTYETSDLTCLVNNL